MGEQSVSGGFHDNTVWFDYHKQHWHALTQRDSLPASSFRSTSACSSSPCLVSCCLLTCSTTVETWLGKRRPATSTLLDRRSRRLTTPGPTDTNLRATAWPPWRLRSTPRRRQSLKDLQTCSHENHHQFLVFHGQVLVHDLSPQAAFRADFRLD